MDPHEQTSDNRSRDAASHGNDSNQPTEVPVATAAAVNSDQHSPSCPPLSQPVVPSQKPLEGSSLDGPRDGCQKRRRTEPISNENPRSEPVASGSEESTEDQSIVGRFTRTRNIFKNIMDTLPTGIFWGKDHQSHTKNVRKGAVIMFAHSEHANDIDGRDHWLNWAPALRGFTVTSERFAVVEKNDGRGGLLLRILTELDDDALSLMRREMYLDSITSDLRPKLDKFLHVVDLDNEDSVVPEPQCFDNDVRLNWRSIEGARVPNSKSMFIQIDEYPKFVRPATLCVVGELAEDGDFLVLRSARDALSDDLDKDDAQEIKRRREDVTRDPIGFALSVIADSLPKNARAPSPAVSDSSQEPGPYTRRYTRESPAYFPRSPNYGGSRSPLYYPQSPDHGRSESPVYMPSISSTPNQGSSWRGESPVYIPTTPNYEGGSGSPVYIPTSPNYEAGSESPVYIPTAPNQGPSWGGGESPVYIPRTPTFME